MRAFLVSIRFVAGVCLLLLFHTSTWAQINSSDGLRAPGDWNSWTNTQDMGGDFDLARLTTGLLRWTTTFQYTGTTGSVSFKFASSGASGVWHNQWSGHAFTMDAVNSVGYGDFGNNTVDLVQNNYYTIVFKDNGYATTDVSLMETSVAPVSVSSSSRATAVATNPGPGQDVTINVTLSAAKSGDERVYLIYTTDSWASRDYVEVTNFSGTTSGSAVIPGQSASTTINYYVMTSTMDLNGVAANEADYDLRSIAIGGSGTYDVAASWTTAASPTSWSAASSWDAGAVPDASTPVTIGQSLTLDADVTVSNLTINSGATLTASDGTNRTLTIASGGAIANNGSFAASSGKVSFAGSGSVTGTIAFNDVSLSGGGVNFGLSSTVNGTMEILTGGYVDTNPPTYGSSSTLKYNPGVNFGVGTEWNSPHHVTVSSGTELDFNASAARSCSGNVNIDAGGHLNMDVMEAALSVAGNVAINGILSMSTLPGGDLEVGGNFELASGGTFNENDRALDFNGAGAQAINGPELTLKYMIVEKQTGTLTLNTPLNIEPGGILWPTQGAMNLDGNALTMRSDATGTAVVGEVGGTVTGNITFERYVPAVTDGVSWLAVGNYVNGATRADWTSSFGTDYHLVLDWDETATLPTFANEAAASPWQPVTNASDALHNDGEGYLVFTVANSSPTLSATGTYNSSQQDLVGLTVSNGANQGGGWHLVSNPFPSAISGTEFLADNASLISRYYMYDNDADVFKTDITGAPTTIDIGQSFWIQVSSAGTVSFEIDQAVASSNSFLRSVDPFDAGMAALRIEQPDGKFGNTFIRFHENATHEWEWELDATHRNSANGWTPELYTQLENNHKLAINSIPAIMEASTVMSFVVETGSSGSVEISAESGYSMPDGTCAFIEDSETGEVMPFTSGESMELDLEPFETYADRFFIHFMNSPEFEATSSYCEGGVVHFVGEDSGLWNIEWSSLDGAMNGEGCVTGLETGHYVFSGENELTHCYTETELEISSVCMGDFNLNGERDITDLLILLVGIQPVENFEGTFPSTDCDCDGAMTTLDLLMFLPQFGNVCAD